VTAVLKDALELTSDAISDIVPLVVGLLVLIRLGFVIIIIVCIIVRA